MMVIDDKEYIRLAKSLSDAVIQNDATTFTQVLGFRRRSQSPSIDEPLLCSSPVIVDLLRRLFVENEPLSADTSFDSVVRALLFMSPSIYETPWQTACEVIRQVNDGKHVGQSGSSTVRSNVVNIQTFLQRTIAFWWEEERKRTASSTVSPQKHRTVKVCDGEALSNRCPRQWILELVTILVEPLLAPETQTTEKVSETSPQILKSSERCCTAQLDLLATVVLLSDDLETPLLHAVLDIIFQNERRIISSRITAWTDTAAELRLYLRDKDWTAVRSRLQMILEKGDSCPLSCRELPGLAKTILSFSLMPNSTSISECEDWLELLVMLLSISAAKGMRTFATVETVLESDLTSAPWHFLMEWATAVSKQSEKLAGITSKWILANLYLLFSRVAQRSGSKLVSRLVAKTPGLGTHSLGAVNKPADYDLNCFCWEQLVCLSFSIQHSVHREDRSFDGSTQQSKLTLDKTVSGRIRSATLRLLRHIFADLRYCGKGKMVGQCTATSEMMTSISCNVFHSLFLKSVEGDLESSRIHAVDRAKTWLHFSSYVIESTDESTGVDGLAVAVVILVTVYCEIPVCRSLMVQSLRRAMLPEKSQDSHVDAIASVYSLVISIILRSLPNVSSFTDSISKEFDLITDIFLEPLPLAAFCDLAWSLSPLPAARRALFEARQLIKTAARIHQTIAIAPSGRGSVDKITSEKCALIALVVLVSTSTRWDNDDVAAWFFLSEIIVENRPSLSIQTRSWLFEQLYECAQKDILRSVVSRHLRRACAIRTLHFIANDATGQSFFTYGNAFLHYGDGRIKQIEDLIGLFRLLFILLQSGNSGNTMVEEERRTAFRRCMGFLHRALTNRKCTDDRATGVQPFSLIDNDDEVFIIYVAFYCLGVALSIPSEYLVFDGKRLPFPAVMKSIITRQECEDMKPCRYEKTLPPWVQSPGPAVDINEARFVPAENQHTAPIRFWLYGMIAGLLLDNAVLPAHNSIIPEKRILSSDTPERLALQIGEAFARRRELSNQLTAGNSDTFPHTLHGVKEPFDLVAFFKAVVPITAQSILKQSRWKIGFSDVVNLLLAILDTCDLVISYLDGDNNVTSRWLPCLWDLYSTVCEHTAATNLYMYLTEHASDTQLKRQTSLQSQHDIDQFVCRLRISTIRAIHAICISSESLLHRPYIHFNPTTLNSSSSVDILSYCCKLVDQLIGDLKSELCGMRGLNYEEYLAFIGCIDQCTANLLEAVPVIATHDEAQSISKICTNSSRSLSVILCTFVLKDVQSFNKTMTLFASTIPALARRSDRRCLVLWDESRSAQEASSAIEITSVFKQLTSIAKRRAESNLDPVRQWREIVGDNHFEGDSDGEGSCCSRDESNNKRDGCIRTVVDDSSYRRVGRRASDSSRRKLRLWSERSWARSLFCFLEAFEDSWEDSHKMQTPSPDTFVSVAKVRIFYERRKSNLAEILECLYPLFQLLPSQDKSDSATVYAMSIPSAIKSKLVSTVDRIFQVLHRSLKSIFVRVHEAPEDGFACEKDVSFAESMCCISSWLEMTTPGAELSSGIRFWYMAEKTAAAKRNKDSVYSVESPILRCLPKLIFRIEDFEYNVSKLSQYLRSSSLGSKSAKKKASQSTVAVLLFLDGLVSGEYTEKNSGSFARIVSKKLKFLKDERRRMECVFGPSNLATKKRKRTRSLENHIRKERRRRLIRSRNAVVDRWLQMDANIGPDEGQNEDTFAELEDFIVDG